MTTSTLITMALRNNSQDIDLAQSELQDLLRDYSQGVNSDAAEAGDFDEDHANLLAAVAAMDEVAGTDTDDADELKTMLAWARKHGATEIEIDCAERLDDLGEYRDC